jgi:class 3 adenylate cyclase
MEAEHRTDPEDALLSVLSRHAPPTGAEQIGEESLAHLAATGSTPVEAVVVVGDLRMSGILLREATSPALYARFIIGFTEAVRGLAADSNGWFDKFTGDGFIAFWLYRDAPEATAQTVPRFCRAILPAAENLIGNLRRNSRNFPVGVGLSIGVDSGPCELVQVGGSLTLVGSAIVGATRMVTGARAGQALVNVHLGTILEKARTELEAEGVRIARSVVRTKEFPEGQEAYAMDFSPPLPAP